MEAAELAGHFKLECRDHDGNRKWTEEVDNLITNNGFDFIVEAVFTNQGSDRMTHIGIGSSNRAAAANQTSLVSQSVRIALSYAHTDGTKVVVLTANFGVNVGTGQVQEIGVFSAANGGTMLSRAVLRTARTKLASDSLLITYTLTLSQQ